MNERSGSDHPRDAFAVLVAARPEPPTELTSPDTSDAEKLFRRILDDPGRQRSPANNCRPFSFAVGAAAAAAVVGILLTVPGRAAPSSVGSSETTTPTQTAIEVVPPDAGTASEWPSIPASPPVGDANTARATVVFDNRWTSGRTDYVMADGDVSILLYGSDPEPRPDGFPPPTNANGLIAGGASTVVAENRYAGGEWYYYLQDPDGDMQWSSDPNDDPIAVDVSPADPRELLDRLSPSAGFEADGTDFVRGLETVHLVAMTPDDVDVTSVPFVSDDAEAITSLELWVDSNGVVRRVGVSYRVPTAGSVDVNGDTLPIDDPYEAATISIEFYDIGEPITIDVPRDVVEIDAQG